MSSAALADNARGQCRVRSCPGVFAGPRDPDLCPICRAAYQRAINEDDFYDSVDALMARAKARKERELVNAVWRAMMLAPTIEICEALLSGEAVPISQLDQEWVRKFGLRHA